VIAVTVVLEDADGSTGRGRELEQQWARWNPGVPLQVLHTEYASVAEPLVAFIDRLREHHDKQIVVLIPVVLPVSCVTSSCTTTTILSCPPRCAATPTSSSPGSRCPWSWPMARTPPAPGDSWPMAGTPPAPGDMECRAAGRGLGSAG